MIALLLAAVVTAAPLPHEVTLAGGAFRSRGGEPLYTFRNDTMVGMSHCFEACAISWPPLLASAQPQPSDAWTLVTREDGSKQWAYRDKPLYTAGLPYDRVKAALAPGGAWEVAKP